MRTARAKGASSGRVMRSHILRNSMLPVVTILGMDHRPRARRRHLHGVDLRPPRPRAVGDRRLREVRSAGDRRRRGLLDDRDHHLQPDRRLLLRGRRPEDPAHLMALLEVENLKTKFKTDDGIVTAVDGVSFTLEKRRDARHRGRVRLREERHLPHDHGPERPAKHASPRVLARLDGVDLLDDRPGVAARAARNEDRDDLPGPDDVAEPGQEDRLATRRGGARPSRRLAQGSARARARGDEVRTDPARRAEDRRLPAPVLGRHAAARDDRDGADQRAGHRDRRRADDGARRDDAGADPRSDERAAAGARDGDHHDHPRSRRRRGGRRRGDRHVRRPGRGARAASTRSSTARATRTRGACSDRSRASTSKSSGSSRSPGSRRRLLNPPSGCRFHPRCTFAMDICRTEVPPARSVRRGLAPAAVLARRRNQGARVRPHDRRRSSRRRRERRS